MSYHVVSGDAPESYHPGHAYDLSESDASFSETGLLDAYGDIEIQFKRAGYDDWLDALPVDGKREGWRFPSENIVAARVKGSGKYTLVFYPRG